MGNYTLDTDFSSLKGRETNDWLLELGNIAEEAFAGRDHRICLLGNLLVMEEYIHTIRDGLEPDRRLSSVLQEASDMLWNYLDGGANPSVFQDFANNLFACILAANVGEDLTEEQEEFFAKYIAGANFSGCEAQAVEWCAVLLISLVSIEGWRLDFEDFKGVSRIDFVGIEEMLTILEDASIDLTGTPRLSNRAVDLQKAEDQVHQTALFQGLVKRIQNCLNTALHVEPDQIMMLRGEFQKNEIIPKKYAKELLEY